MTAKIRFTRTETAMNKWGDVFVEKLKTQMKIDKTDASGKTRKSIKQKTKGTTTHILSDGKGAAATLELIDKGFITNKPAPPYEPIKEWMKSKGIRPKRKGKFVRTTEMNYKRAAIAIAIGIGYRGAIKRFGYGGSGILDFTWKRIEPAYTENVMGAYVEDVETYLNNNTKRVVK